MEAIKSNAAKSNSAPKEFTDEQWRLIDGIIQKNRNRTGALIPVLEEIQEITGYLPLEILQRIAGGLKIPFSEVYGVVTFYSFFTMVPRGKHTVRCCLGTACYVRGGKKNLEKLSGLLKVAQGETTEDQLYTLETVRCLGACGLAPVMVVDEDTYRQMKPSKIPEILDRYE